MEQPARMPAVSAGELLVWASPAAPTVPPLPAPSWQVDVDISSSSVAASVTNLVAGGLSLPCPGCARA